VIIAVDGPAASGKGTIARALARHYGLPHLDTGLLYRAVGISVARAGGDPDDPEDALAAAGFPDSLLDDADLRSEAAGPLASRVSRHPGVRAALLARQRAFATQPGGAVLDGRDIGTVIAPDADAKLFVTASVAVRGRRRFAELRQGDPTADLDTIRADLVNRDARDSGRADAPMLQAEDAVLLDTTDLDRDQALAAAIAIVEARIRQPR